VIIASVRTVINNFHLANNPAFTTRQVSIVIMTLISAQLSASLQYWRKDGSEAKLSVPTLFTAFITLIILQG
jgi:hypothetical protein